LSSPKTPADDEYDLADTRRPHRFEHGQRAEHVDL
jgi:hypothetical protein